MSGVSAMSSTTRSRATASTASKSCEPICSAGCARSPTCGSTIHGTTGEPLIARFKRDEQSVLKPLLGRAPFLQVREVSRRVHTDACIELDTNRYSVPWKLIGESVTVIVAEEQVRVLNAGHEVARHAQCPLRRSTVIDRTHLVGIVGAGLAGVTLLPRTAPASPAPVSAELLRPLEQYEAILGGP